MKKFKNILIDTTCSYTINADIAKNLIDYLKPESSTIIVESENDLLERKNEKNILIDLRDNQGVNFISRVPFMYDSIDDNVLNDCKPIDTSLLEQMSKYETVIFSQLQRNGLKYRNFYVAYERYLSVLKYWNTFLEKNKIDLFISHNIPHEGFDYIIYCLCKIKKIKTIMSFQSPMIGQIYVMRDIEENCFRLKETIQKYEKEFKNSKEEDIPLNEFCQKLVNKYFSDEDTTPFYMKKEKKSLKDYFLKLKKIVAKAFTNIKKGVLIKNLKDKALKKKKLIKEYKKVKKFYEKISIKNLDAIGEGEKFIYFPLHFQPEMTSNPCGDRFENQEFIIQMISHYLPEGYFLYIKEHPKQQDNIYRSKEFFARINKLKNVRLMSTTVKTEELSDKCIATATITGTAAWESLFKLKPVLLFGNFCYQECKGVFKIKNNNDLVQAINKIINEECLTKKDMLIFVKALNDCSTFGYTDECYKKLNVVEYEEALSNVTEKIIDIIENG